MGSPANTYPRFLVHQRKGKSAIYTPHTRTHTHTYTHKESERERRITGENCRRGDNVASLFHIFFVVSLCLFRFLIQRRTLD